MITVFDVETTTKNKGNPFTASNKLISYAVKSGTEDTSFHYHTDIEFMKALRESFDGVKTLIGFNIKFDLHWARRMGILPPDGVRIWDCQIAEFLIRGQVGPYPSLNEALARFNVGQKDDKIAEYWALGVDTDAIPLEELRTYNLLDVELTHQLYRKQLEVMSPKLTRLCWVMGLDTLVLEEMEWNGIKLNVDTCREKAVATKAKLEEITNELLTFSPTPYINFDSGHQLSCLLYGGAFEVERVTHEETLTYKSGQKKGLEYLKQHKVVETILCEQLFIPLKGTETKLESKAGELTYKVYATGEDVLKRLRTPSRKHKRIIELLLARALQAKLLDTYYGALPGLLEKMEWGDTLHGQLNQVVARTGRLSASNPNQQNFNYAIDLLLVSRYD